MSHLFAHYLDQILAQISKWQDAGELPAELPTHAITAEPPRDPSHGCIATNAAMVLAKPAKTNPRALAEKLVAEMQAWDGVASAEVAGPGFINLRLDDAVWQRELLAMLTAGTGYGDSTIGAGTRVNVEYVSANPTGPMHVGHARGAVVGDALSGLLAKAGYAVTKEYYINDAGAQVDVLARSVHLRYREACGEDIGDIPSGFYPGDYLVPVGEALAKEFGDQYKEAPEAEWLELFRERATEAMMAMIRDDLAALGVRHDVFASEKQIVASGKVEEALEALEKRGLLYVGVLEPPKGKKPEDWEERPQTLFKSTDYGDDVDRPIKKSDGSYTYFTPDIAYHYDKYRRGHEVLVDVLGADHGGYVSRIKAAVRAMTEDKGRCEVLLCQLVSLMKEGQPFKMSKRAGNFVTLRDVVDLIGKDVLRFIMLTRKSDATLSFDVDQVQEQSKENPVFYVQYAHARCCSVLRHAETAMPDMLKAAEAAELSALGSLSHAQVVQLMRKLATWPRVVEQAATAFEPHRIAFFLQELASEFHTLWNMGNSDATLRFLREEDEAATIAYLVLVMAVKTVIASGLATIGVTPVEELKHTSANEEAA